MRPALILGVILMLCAAAGCTDPSFFIQTPLIHCPDSATVHTGQATFYTFASGAGACMYDSTPGDLMIGAMNLTDYQGSIACGECVSLTGPRGTIMIRIVDLCPDCPKGNIDLSPLAFSMIADTSLGKVPITWQVVDCGVTGPILYHFMDSSSQYWTAVQIRNQRYPIGTFEYRKSDGTYKAVGRTTYDYFVEPSGMGPGPYTFRVMDVYGHYLVDTLIAPAPNASVPGRGQFPSCFH